VVYDAARGRLVELPVGSGASEVCIDPGSVDLTVEDATTPTPGDGFYFLVRGHNACGAGAYGLDSSGAPRTTHACP
jgi:hypothetical protein